MAHVIYLVLFPEQDRLTNVNPFAYPWMSHELGHNRRPTVVAYRPLLVEVLPTHAHNRLLTN